MNIQKTLKNIELKAKKGLGQNFLHDEDVLNSILRQARLKPDETVLEIGGGLGILTDRLSKEAGYVISLEVDPALHKHLSQKFRNRHNVRVILEDILKYDPRDLPGHGVKVIANLPYYISTPILFHLIEFIQRFSLILIMLQKELAERITAPPGTKRYGSLSIAVQYYTQAEISRWVPRTAFYPVPAVDSALVRLDVLETPRVRVSDSEAFFKTVRAAFAQRRKTLRNSLLGSGRFSAEKLDTAFAAAEISPTRRAETLSIDEFAELSRFLI